MSLIQKRSYKLINKAKKNIIVDAENNVLDKKRVNELINEVKDNNVADTEYNDLESESNIKNFWKRKEYCNLRFTIKEILFVLGLLILLSFGAHVARKNMISGNNNKFGILNDILYFISNLLSIT